ncbi:MAG: adenosylhomocysteinase, partial [Chloroflexi bacterium]|nr:adenosylhomocysteinase [Chloroflexota bacterium]
NSGHFNVELNLDALAKVAVEIRQPRTFVQQYVLADGRVLNVLGEGRLINLAAAEGHPSAVMDMSFANQALSAEFMVQNHASLEKQVYAVPAAIDASISRLKLQAMGVQIDVLTPEQEKYLSSWSMGT